jgi:hypothetical protein
MKKEYAPIHLDYENSNDPDYQFDESIPSITSNKSQPKIVISEFTDNKTKYLFFESMTNQVSHAPSLAINEIELTTYEEVINGPESTAWKYIIQKEFDSLIKNQIWQLIELLSGSKVLSGRWMYKRKIVKIKENYKIRQKARWIAKDYL